MKSPVISIIMPVYNAEKYLSRSINSVINQTFFNWELLLINDGSKDRSGEICNHYAKLDKRIQVFHKENGGVSSAREIGVQNSIGNFSIHIDPDDWIDPMMLELLYTEALHKKADIIICDFILDYGNNHQVISKQQISGSENMLQALLTHHLHGSLCNKLIRNELYKKYDIHFPSEMICWEDLFICCNIAIHQPKISYINKPLYHYDLHSNNVSMTRCPSIKTIHAMKLFCDYFNNLDNLVEKEWIKESKEMTIVTAYKSKLLNKNDIKKLYPEIHKEFINKYKKQYHLPLYNATAKFLSGQNEFCVRHFEKINGYCQRIYNKLSKISTLRK